MLAPLPAPAGMNSREIVCRAIEYRDPPRVPYSFYLNPHASDLFTLMGGRNPINKPADRGATYVDEWGVTWEVSGRFWDHAVGYPLADLAELASYQFPQLDDPGLYAGLKDLCHKSTEAGKYNVVGDPVMMFERMRSVMGFEELMVAPYTQAAGLDELLDRMADLTIACLQQYAELGDIDGFMTWEDWGLQTGMQMDMETFRRFYRPRYQRIIDATHELGMHYIWHNCGNVEEMLPDKIEMGVDVVQFDQPRLSGHERLMQLTGGKLCMWNTVDIQWSVADGVTEEEIRQEVETMLRTYRPDLYGGGFIARHYPQPMDIELSVERQQLIYKAFMENGCSLPA